MTRARSELYLSVPAVTGHGARQRPTEPSPFLTEIPENLRTTTGNADIAARRNLLIPAAQIYRIMLGNDADAWPSVLKPPTSDDRLVPKGIP